MKQYIKTSQACSMLTLNEKTKFSSARNSQGTGVNHGQNLFPGHKLLKVQQGTGKFHQITGVCFLYSHKLGDQKVATIRETKAFFLAM